MPSRLNPYLGFIDKAREAMEFYRSVFGGELTMSTFAEGGMPHGPADANKIMHAQLEAPNGFLLMASDAPAGMDTPAQSNISLSLSGDDEPALRGYWDKLAQGGMVTVPLETAPWGDAFGMLADKYGVAWMVNISGKKQ